MFHKYDVSFLKTIQLSTRNNLQQNLTALNMNEWRNKSFDFVRRNNLESDTTEESIDGGVDQTSFFFFDNPFDDQLDARGEPVGHRELAFPRNR